MTNTSATGGYLIPYGFQPEQDQDLEDILQAAIVGITGLDPSFVVPKFQEVPPNRPDREVDWCAFSATVTDADVNPTLVHRGQNNGDSVLSRSEELEIMVSFYGPGSRGYATGLRDGLGISQNREVLRSKGLAFVLTQRLTLVPDFTNSEYIRRTDLIFSMRRMVNRVYAIENVDSIQGDIVTEQGSGSTL